jgi:hypothetical protein
VPCLWGGLLGLGVGTYVALHEPFALVGSGVTACAVLLWTRGQALYRPVEFKVFGAACVGGLFGEFVGHALSVGSAAVPPNPQMQPTGRGGPEFLAGAALPAAGQRKRSFVRARA